MKERVQVLAITPMDVAIQPQPPRNRSDELMRALRLYCLWIDGCFNSHKQKLAEEQAVEAGQCIAENIEWFYTNKKRVFNGDKALTNFRATLGFLDAMYEDEIAELAKRIRWQIAHPRQAAEAFRAGQEDDFLRKLFFMRDLMEDVNRMNLCVVGCNPDGGQE